jgi:hypothetical protein
MGDQSLVELGGILILIVDPLMDLVAEKTILTAARSMGWLSIWLESQSPPYSALLSLL